MTSIHHMSCPTALVQAPIEIVWALLTDPSRWGEFFDLRNVSAAPPGIAALGQLVRAESGPRFLHLRLSFRFREIDESRRRLRFDVRLPFGVSVIEELTCVPLDKGQCRVNYECNFGFPSGIRGRLMRRILGRAMQAGPADSLSRLKKRAEQIQPNVNGVQ